MANRASAYANKGTNVRSSKTLLLPQLLLKFGFLLVPGWAAGRAARMFLRPWQKPRTGRSWYVSRETPFAAESPRGPVAGYSFGRAGDPTVLLVHGWEDDHLSWAPLIDKLVARGYRVLALDLPGHGRSPSKLTGIPMLAEGIAALGREAELLGATPIHATIAHSLGATATVVAAAEMGLKPGRLALLAPPNHPRLFASSMMRMLGLSKGQVERVLTEIERLIGRSMDSLYLPPMLRRIAGPGLLLHSRDDKVVPLQHGQENAAAWTAAQFHILDGLGHRRLMTDEGVHGMLLHFIATEAAKTDAAD
jgi:pimeloyl-ACP methyl ester carboxylesterase